MALQGTATPRRPATRQPAAAAGGPGPDAAAQVLRQLRLVFNAVKTHFQQVEKKVGVGGAQLWALSVVQDNPGIGMNDLARAMDLHQSTASNLVKSLVQRELLRAVKNGADKRTVQLQVQPAGRRILKRAPGPFTGVLPEALASLDAKALARLRRDLGVLINALGADARGAEAAGSAAPAATQPRKRRGTVARDGQ